MEPLQKPTLPRPELSRSREGQLQPKTPGSVRHFSPSSLIPRLPLPAGRLAAPSPAWSGSAGLGLGAGPCVGPRGTPGSTRSGLCWLRSAPGTIFAQERIKHVSSSLFRGAVVKHACPHRSDVSQAWPPPGPFSSQDLCPLSHTLHPPGGRGPALSRQRERGSGPVLGRAVGSLGPSDATPWSFFQPQSEAKVPQRPQQVSLGPRSGPGAPGKLAFGVGEGGQF